MVREVSGGGVHDEGGVESMARDGWSISGGWGIKVKEEWGCRVG